MGFPSFPTAETGTKTKTFVAFGHATNSLRRCAAQLCRSSSGPPALFTSHTKRQVQIPSKRGYLSGTIEGRNEYPGYHLRFSRSTQSVAVPLVIGLSRVLPCEVLEYSPCESGRGACPVQCHRRGAEKRQLSGSRKSGSGRTGTALGYRTRAAAGNAMPGLLAGVAAIWLLPRQAAVGCRRRCPAAPPG